MYLPDDIETQLNELSGIDKRITIETQIIEREQVLIAITLDKSLINFHSKEPLDVIRFALLLKPDYPKIPPLLYCLTRFCLPELCDGRDFLEDTLQMKWDSQNCFLKLIISQIPSFVDRYLLYYSNNNNNQIGIRKMFGKYYLDSIYELSIIKYIPYLYFDVISEVVGNDGVNMNLEDRKLLLTDNFVLLFYNKSLYELDQLRLVFIGPITSLIHIRQFIQDGIVLLKWMVRGKNVGSNNIFQMELRTPDGDYIVDTLIENLSKRSIQFKVTNKIGDNIKREGSVPMIEINLVEEEIKHLENKINSKEDVTKESISVLVNLYEKAIQYYSALNDMRFEIYIKKLHDIYSNNEYTSLLNMKTITGNNEKYNVTQFKRKRKKRTGNEEGDGKKKKEKNIKKKNDKNTENKDAKEIVNNDNVNNNDNKIEDKKEEIINNDNINNDNINNDNINNDDNKNEIINEENNIIDNNNNIINGKEDKKEENVKGNKDDKDDKKESRPKRNSRKREEGNKSSRKNRKEKKDKNEDDEFKKNQMYIDKKEIEEMIKNELSMDLLNNNDNNDNKNEIKIDDNSKDKEINGKEENKNEDNKDNNNNNK